jgi:hypothetical protein
MAITYSIEFAAQIARLEEGVKRGSRSVQKMASEMEGAANFARNAMLGLAGALGVGSFVGAVKGASEAADAAAKMGDRFGIATEKLIGMQHAGQLAGVSNEALATGLRSMAKTGIEAARGGEEAAKAYGMLGIKAGEFVKLPMDQQFSIIIDKLGQVENVTLRNALAQEVLGKAAGEVMGLVAEGSDSFAKAAEDAQAWGLAINRVDAAKLEMANDAITRAQAAAKGLFTTIAIYVAPAVKALADYFADSAAEAKGFKQEAASGAEVVITGIGYAANVVQGLRFAYVGVKLVIAEVLNLAAQGFAFFADNASIFGKALMGLPGPLGLVGRAFSMMVGVGKNEFRMLADSTAENASRIKEELDAIALDGLPKDKIIEKVREIRALMEKEAVEIAKRRQDMMRGSGEDIEKDKEPEKKTVRDSWREQLEQKLERLREENMNELQLLDEKLREKNVLLDTALQAGLITEEAAAAQSALIQKKYAEAKTKIEDAEIKKRYGIAHVYRVLDLNSASAFFGAMSSMMDSKSRTAFNIGKAAAISGAIIDTYKAATGAYSALSGIPYVGPFLGAAAAIAAIVAGMARVQQIRSTQFGGGGAASAGATGVFSASPATGLPTEPISPLQAPVEPPAQLQAAQAQNVNITLIGDRSTSISYGQMVDEFIPLLKEASANGAVNLNVAFA